MAPRVTPAPIDADNSSGNFTSAACSDWRTGVRRFHVGTGHTEPTHDAGYTTAGLPQMPKLSINSLLRLGGVHIRRVRPRHTLLVRRGTIVGRAIRRRQAGGWIGDEQPGKEHDCGNRKEPKRTAGEVLTNDANGSAGRDANEEQRNAAEEIWGRRYARRSRRWVARRCAVQHERSNA
jgi:hypothetical protein